MIDTRPASVETRRQAGHREGDPIDGAHETGNPATLVERTTRFTLVGRTDSKEAAEVGAVIESLLAPLQMPLRLSVTFDNGKEFAQHEALARRLGLDVCFAKPCHSRERGTNENTNGLIRRLHPGKSSFAGIGQAGLDRIDTFLNDRPRKCLGWMTPREKMAACLVSALDTPSYPSTRTPKTAAPASRRPALRWLLAGGGAFTLPSDPALFCER